jgi:hypothetical protein
METRSRSWVSLAARLAVPENNCRMNHKAMNTLGVEGSVRTHGVETFSLAGSALPDVSAAGSLDRPRAQSELSVRRM